MIDLVISFFKYGDRFSSYLYDIHRRLVRTDYTEIVAVTAAVDDWLFDWLADCLTDCNYTAIKSLQARRIIDWHFA